MGRAAPRRLSHRPDSGASAQHGAPPPRARSVGRDPSRPRPSSPTRAAHGAQMVPLGAWPPSASQGVGRGFTDAPVSSVSQCTLGVHLLAKKNLGNSSQNLNCKQEIER